MKRHCSDQYQSLQAGAADKVAILKGNSASKNQKQAKQGELYSV